jgi:membrane-associated phospholipid phosphatase
LALSRAIRTTAWAIVGVGVAAPLVRRRTKLSGRASLAAAATAPVAVSVAMRPGRQRDLAVCVLQMWAYFEAYKVPYADPEAAASRVRIEYPILADRVIGLGGVPSARLQRAFSTRGEINRFERALVWCHWLWFLVPHASVIYVAWRRPERFARAAARMYAVFDLGALVYFAVPTAPPWWASANGRLAGPDGPAVRRMMIEYGEIYWGERWGDLYDLLGGNPLAAMPSLHFATSLMAARLLSEVGPVAGAVGWSYAGLLGLSLVYLGEHYAIDLVAGAALEEAVHRGSRPLARPARLLSRALGGLGARATRA